MLIALILFCLLNSSILFCLPLNTIYEEYNYNSENINKTGELVKDWSEDSEINPEELGEYIEGDILFPSHYSKNGIIAETARWPGGVIPYEINGWFTNKEKNLINASMELYHKYTCIRFRKRLETDPDWISIINTNSGCWSSVGRLGGKQEINLQCPNCLLKIGTVLHELLHSVGFYHEQNRWERDSYIKIHYDNIQKGKENNFKKADKNEVYGFEIPYDYGSVMHYSEKAFSKNGEPTISILQNTSIKIGQREGFSEGDIHKVRAMYNCPNTTIDLDNNNVVSENGNGNLGLLGELISIAFP